MTTVTDPATKREVSVQFDAPMGELVARSSLGSLVTIYPEQFKWARNDNEVAHEIMTRFGEFFPYDDSKSLLM